MSSEKIQQQAAEIKEFIRTHYRHFNAAVLKDAAEAYVEHLNAGGKMFLAMAGAMSTAELGLSLAEMIRQDKIHAVSCTAANFEEDLFNLVAHDHYRRVPHYRQLTPQEERALAEEGLNRVTDTCIPEGEAIRRLEQALVPYWSKADTSGQSRLPYEFFYQAIRDGALEPYYQIDPKDSWVVAACEKDLPVWTPGWEDSTLANGVVAGFRRGRYGRLDFIQNGLQQMDRLIDWYLAASRESSIGFFQIGGGIAGDFPICVVPLIKQDMQQECPFWGYFCQISDSTTSYGSYSGAVPNEKITWEKLDVKTPRFVIESDASIVAPLIFQYVLAS
jgi:deoxyhypusine synthase